MRIRSPLTSAFALIALFVLAGVSVAQKPKPKPVAKAAKPIVFAVLNDGATLEPIANINRGKLQPAVDGGAAANLITAFHKSYYKPGTLYRLVFGGANAGSVTVKKADPNAECSKNMAEAVTADNKTPLRGLVMGLATNASFKSKADPYRRKPSAAEKDELEALVRAEFAKHKLAPKTLRYHNLTGLDLNNDGKAEFVGSYWIEVDKLTRALLFFIASKGSNGKYVLAYREYRTIDEARVMSGDIKSVDEGVYHELLLDAFDYDLDGVNEVFTYTQSFEGAGFNVYRLNRGKWIKTFEGSNYHCGY